MPGARQHAGLCSHSPRRRHARRCVPQHPAVAHDREGGRLQAAPGVVLVCSHVASRIGSPVLCCAVQPSLPAMFALLPRMLDSIDVAAAQVGSMVASAVDVMWFVCVVLDSLRLEVGLRRTACWRRVVGVDPSRRVASHGRSALTALPAPSRASDRHYSRCCRAVSCDRAWRPRQRAASCGSFCGCCEWPQRTDWRTS